jgi:hypothetical protein
MDYKKKYEKLVDAVKVLQDNNPSDEGIQNWVNDNVPELKESEDERIRKAIIESLPKHGYLPQTNIAVKDAITLLEKLGNKPQGKSALEATREEKVGNANKIEPKLKIEKDKWYVCIRDLDDNYGTKAFCKGSIYYSTKDETLLSDNSNIPFEIKYCVNDYFRPWTIQDAKDGDVLVTVDDKNHPFIYKGCLDPNHPDSPVAYCGIDADGYFCRGGGKFNHWWTSDKVQPATKEQRDTLMKAMTDAGYTFDFDKKELKLLISNGCDFESNNSKQKSVEWSERKAILTGLIDCRDAPDLGWSNFGGIKIDDCIAWLEKQGEPNPYSGVSFKYNGHTWGMCARDNGVEILVDGEIKERVFLCNKPQGKSALEAIREEKVYNVNKIEPKDYSSIDPHFGKPIDKVEPKFHKGEWTVSKLDRKARQISEVHFDEYNSYYVVNGKSVNLEEYDRLHHSWTIQDAKDGDVLVEESCIFIIQKLGDNCTAAKTHCTLFDDGDFDDGSILYFDIDSTKLASEEEKQQLFDAIKSNGYKWNSETKTLENVIEPKFKVGDIVQYITDSTDRRKIEEIDTLCNMYHTDSSPIMFEIEDEWKSVLNSENVEQNLSDKVEPKFHKGDWIVFNGLTLYVKEVVKGFYRTISKGGISNSYDWDIDKIARLWTIQYANEGDVLATEDKNFTTPFVAIYKSIGDTVYDNITFNSHCFIGFDGNFYGGEEGHTIEDIHPATKEQRKLLSQKMKEADYKWDAEKKELMKVEQNNTNWSDGL